MKSKTFFVLLFFVLCVGFMLFCGSKSPDKPIIQTTKDIVEKIVVEKGVDVSEEQKIGLANQIIEENKDLSKWFADGNFQNIAVYLEKKNGIITEAKPEYKQIKGIFTLERHLRKLKNEKSLELTEGQKLELEIETKFIFVEAIDSQIYYQPERKYDKINLVAHEYFNYYIRIKQGEETVSNSNGGGNRDHKHRAGCPWDG